ncbi:MULTISPECIES: flagellar hook-associated protein FlgL [Cobetia]|uniref:flagellar hook-associated protein FlgL n=1 Tax=Cobetia TaxID=204286 RepID=UPI0015832522|nr:MULTISPECIES: flagellar hook-associated protein FlgL [Cobetia]MDI4661047.1 flagellar hook-associated protein FlgL [Cobetia sp. BMC6]NUJ55634.1 flagellar hook-associated protein FlgL [Cobetia marina]
MRISTQTLYAQGVTSMLDQQAAFSKVSEQLATGRRVVNPSDDPSAASQAVTISQSQAVNEQFSDSRTTARNNLSIEESALNQVTDTITRVQSLIVQAGNGTLSDSDRDALATEIEGNREVLLGLANSTDGNGNYLFGGMSGDTAPFDEDGSYRGDDEQRQQRVDSSRLMEVNHTGSQIFGGVASGNQQLARQTSESASSLPITFKGPEVIDASARVDGAAYSVSIDAAGVTISGTDAEGNDLSILDDEGNPLPSPVAFSDGMTLAFNGLSMTLSGDEQQVAEAQASGKATQLVIEEGEASADLFANLDGLITALSTPIESEADQAAFNNAISTASRQFSNSLDNVLAVRADVGTKLNELDSLDIIGDDRELNYASTRSGLIDLDYNEAISDYSLTQVGLQASQQAFSDISGMSLFDYLR